jgi:hypothetical protein
MWWRKFGSVLLDFVNELGEAFFRERKIPRRTWSGGVVAADILCVGLCFQIIQYSTLTQIQPKL